MRRKAFNRVVIVALIAPYVSIDPVAKFNRKALPMSE